MGGGSSPSGYAKIKNMFYTPEQKGLTPEEVNQKVEELWQEALSRSGKDCPDCAVKVGKYHEEGCDVARCLACNGQRISCDCDGDEERYNDPDTWTGFWPGVKECYEQKLICWDDSIAQRWCFDLNTLAIQEMNK